MAYLPAVREEFIDIISLRQNTAEDEDVVKFIFLYPKKAEATEAAGANC